MPIKLIIFDKDGVLLDLSQTWASTIVNIARHTESLIDGRVHHRDLLKAIGVELNSDGSGGTVLENGLYASGTYGSLVPAWGALDAALIAIMNTPAYADEMMAIATRSVRGQTAPKGAVQSALAELKSDGYQLGVVTNDGAPTTAINLDDLGLTAMMDHIVTADSGHGRKPEPGGILALCERLGVNPDEAVMIGDTHADHDAAIAAACRHVIAVTNEAPNIPAFMPKSSFAIPDCAALPALMRQING
jgi:phosphoglycolate phosphatase